MAQYTLRGNEKIDLLTQDELRHELGQFTTTWYQEAARGVSTARFTDTATVATGAVQIPASGRFTIGPDKGFAWTLQRVSVQGLATNDVVTLYRNVITPQNFIAQLTAASPWTTFGSRGVILRGEESLILTGASLAATGDITVNGEAIEVPELDLYKLL